MTKQKQSERDEAISKLRETLKPGTTVYTVLRHVSRSGMSRDIDVYVMEGNEPRRITWTVAKAANLTYNRKAEAIKIGGCGMDMGFAIVYNLSRALYDRGHEFLCIGKDCPSNDHSNAWYSVRDGVCPCCKRNGLNKAEHQQANDTGGVMNQAKATPDWMIAQAPAMHSALEALVQEVSALREWASTQPITLGDDLEAAHAGARAVLRAVEKKEEGL